MSRYTHQFEETDFIVAYGYDIPMSEYFLQVFENGKTIFSIGNYFIMTPHPDYPSKVQYSNSEMYELMKEWGCDDEHLSAVALDLPF